MAFETDMARLEEIARLLENGEIPLDDAVASFEEGMRLYKTCMKKLSDTEKRIEVLLKDKDGEPVVAPFESESLSKT